MTVWVLLIALISPSGETDINTEVHRTEASCLAAAKAKAERHANKVYVGHRIVRSQLQMNCGIRIVR